MSSTSGTHLAALIPSPDNPIKVTSLPTPRDLKPHELLIKVSAMGINPIDNLISMTGTYAHSYPMLTGSEIAGTIVSLGSGITNPAFKPGTRVLNCPTYFARQDNQYAGFQEFVVGEELATVPIPDSTKFEEAVVLGVGLSTAACAFYPEDYLGLQLPTIGGGQKHNGKRVLIWGGAGSVGCAAIQLAVASGYEVIVTASAKNFTFVEDLVSNQGGKVKTFDYKKGSVVGDIVEELSKEGGGEFVGAFDAIGTEETQLTVGTILAQLGGGKMSVVLPSPEAIPSTVTTNMVESLAIFVKYTDIGKNLWGEFLPEALATGQIMIAPTPQVYGKGIESVQGAMDKLKEGVSATKIVVTL